MNIKDESTGRYMEISCVTFSRLLAGGRLRVQRPIRPGKKRMKYVNLRLAATHIPHESIPYYTLRPTH